MRRLTVIAGPHGAGKTSLMQGRLGRGILHGTYVDAQEIHDSLKTFYAIDEHRGHGAPDYTDRAHEKAFSTRFRLVKKARDVSAECTMGEVEDLDLLDAARKNDYHISLYFFGLNDWRACYDRIRSTPGHWLSRATEEDIYGNYHRALAMLPGAILLADRGIVYDNSSKRGPQELLKIVDGRVEIMQKNLPDWVVEPLTRCL